MDELELWALACSEVISRIEELICVDWAWTEVIARIEEERFSSDVWDEDALA